MPDPTDWKKTVLWTVLGVVGSLLVLFGGGCVALAIAFGDYGPPVSVVLVMGVLPLAAGLGLIVWRRRASRRTAEHDARESDRR